MMGKDKDTGFRFTGKMFLGAIIGFFAIVITANLIMVNFALDSFDGLVEEDAYQKGRDYNAVLDAVAAQEALGWEGYLSLPVKQGGVAAKFILVAADGTAITAQNIKLNIRRPSRSDLDQTVTLVEAAEGGVYRAMLNLPLAGRWQIRLLVIDGESLIFRQDYNLFLPRKKD